VRRVYSVEDVGEQSVKLHTQTTETSWLRVWGVAMVTLVVVVQRLNGQRSQVQVLTHHSLEPLCSEMVNHGHA
jgi:hypothetical protein